MLTAGALDKLGTTSTMTELSRSGGFADKLTCNLINATGRALTSTAINGGDLQGALKAAIVGGLVDTAQGQAASLIGQSGADNLSHKLAHALVGCVAGAAAGGQCKDGAIGGAIGEVVAEMFKDQRPGNLPVMQKSKLSMRRCWPHQNWSQGPWPPMPVATRKRPSPRQRWPLPTTF